MFSPRFFFALLVCACALVLSVQCIYRLPRIVKPVHYNLTLEPLLQDDDDLTWERTPFLGSVHIELIAVETFNIIPIHSKNLQIDYDRVRVIDLQRNGAIIHVSSYSIKGQHQIHEIVLDEDLLRGNSYVLEIDSFSGYLGNGEGFFLAKYSVNSTVARRIAVSHFEPSSARKAFPCFDEPALKATFTINLVRKENYNCISNEGLDTTKDLGNGRFKDTFKTTPPMSTFTVAFAVSDFPATEWLEGHRVLGRPSSIIKGDGIYARDIGIQTLKKLIEYTGVSYPISKMEQFAVPDGYFFNHAMENYGLVIFGETHLLRNNDSAMSDIKRTTVYISHEFAHQWFGNLVTPEWWDYLWLSESFAAYCQYYIAQYIKPSWQLMDQFIIDVVRTAFVREQFSRAAPLNYPIRNIGQYPPFHIMYEKGATIVRMLSAFIKPELLRKGLQLYFNTHKFNNTVPSDMYAAYQTVVEEAGVKHLLGNNTVEEIMTTWDSTNGYPVVHVTRDYATGDVVLKQEEVFENAANQTRRIPINWAYSEDENLDFDDTTADYWLVKKSEIVHSMPKDGWLVINKQQTGYYRVLYDPENWERLISILNSDNFTQIHPISRAQLIDDAFNLAQRKMLPYDVALRLGDYIKREREYVPLSTFISAIRQYLNPYSFFPNGRETNYFKNYTLTNSIESDASTSQIHRAYLTQNLRDIYTYFKNKPADKDTTLEKLARSKISDYYYYFEEP